MKATARKLLALIMAMAMCLSLLQGVAFAAESSEEAPEAAPEVVDVVEDEKEEVETQEDVVVEKAIVTKIAFDDKHNVTVDYKEKGANKSYTFDVRKKDKYPAYVDVKEEEQTNAFLIGGFKGKVTYTVTAKDGYFEGKEAPKDTKTVADDQNRYQLDDSSIAWTALSNSQNWVEASVKTVKERSGFVYQEKDEKGEKWNVFFKLYPTKTVKVNGKETVVFDESGAVYYTKYTTPDSNKLSNDKAIRDALFASTVVELTGDAATAGKDFYKDRTLAVSNFERVADKFAISSYNADFINFSSDDFTVTNNSKATATIKFVSTTKLYAKFDVRLDTTVKVGGQDKTLIVSDPEVIKTEVQKKLIDAVVTEVSATATNGYWTVTVKGSGVGGSTEVDTFKSLKDNTTRFLGVTAGGVTVSGSTTPIGLRDLSKDGTYWVIDPKGETALRTIDKETKVLGPVAIRTDKLPAEITKPSVTVTAADGYKYYVLPSVQALVNETCVAKNISYVSLVMNPIINGKENDGVEATTTIVTDNGNVGDDYTAVTNWAAMIGQANKNFETVPGTYTLPGDENKHVVVVEYSEKAATCKQKGQRSNVAICKHCGKTLATDTEEIPVVTVTAARNTAPGSSMVFTKAEYEAKYPTAVTPHYISSYTLEKVDPTKTSEGKVIAHYFCNLGEEHEELKTETKVNKKDLEYADKWSYAPWGNQNTQWARDPENLYGYTPMIFDMDKDLKEVPMTEDAYYHFEFYGATLQPDGTYYAVGTAKRNGTTTGYEAKTAGATYFATVVVSDIKLATAECLDGSAVVTLQVYKEEYSGLTTNDIRTAEKLAKAIADKKVSAVETGKHVKDIVIPAHKTHIDANADGKCDTCGIEIESPVDPDDPTKPTKTDISGAIIEGSEAYRGEYFNVAYTVKLDGKTLREGIDFVLTNPRKNNFKGVGSHKIVASGMGDYTGDAIGYVWITETSQKVTVSPTKTTLKVKALKKKATSFKIDVKGAKGAVSFSSSSKKVTVSKAGKVTVKKGTKKGTYKVTVKVAKNGGFKAVTKTVTITVK